jgi:hypothetical protein
MRVSEELIASVTRMENHLVTANVFPRFHPDDAGATFLRTVGSEKRHGYTSQKTAFLIVTAEKTSNLTGINPAENMFPWWSYANTVLDIQVDSHRFIRALVTVRIGKSAKQNGMLCCWFSPDQLFWFQAPSGLLAILLSFPRQLRV